MIKMLNRLMLVGIICFAAYGFAVNFPSDEPTYSQTEDVKVGLGVGNVAPELEFEDPNGKMRALSSLRGKVVLIDFWASWCRPCRFENPNVVRVFEKYRDKKFKNGKGFTVYSVSLDKNKEQWKQAIMQDKLNWEYHVSDLKFWGSEAAKIYKIRAIPTNYLINGDGIIVAKNLRGEALENALSRIAVN